MAITLNGIVAEGEPFDIYREMISDVFEAEREEHPAPFSANVRASAFGSMFLHYGSHDAATYRRDAARTRSDGLDDFGLLAVSSGRFDFAAGNREGQLKAGQILVIDRSAPLVLRAGRNVQATLNIPRDLMRDLCSSDPEHGSVLAGRGGKILHGFLQTVGRLGSTGEATEKALYALLEEALNESVDRELPQSDRLEWIRATALAFIEERLTDPDLPVDRMCREIGVSRSNLYRAFGGVGVADVVQRKRLERARLLLRSSGAQVADVARKCGFRSPSSLSAQFRRYYGITPRDYRTANGLVSAPGMSALEAKVRMTRWQDILSQGTG